MLGSEFVATYGPKGFSAWEMAAVDLARKGSMVDWGWEEVTVKRDDLIGVLRVQRDVFAIGTREDCIRMPIMPETAQTIANEQGWMLETPLLAYLSWRSASIKLPRTPMVPNKGPSLAQFAEHSRLIDAQVAGRVGLVAGHKKSVVVGNIYKPGKVLIFGWYKPEPDVFDDKTPMTNPERQPRQPYSNVHGNFYLDYSHGIRFVSGTMKVNGQELLLAEVMTHPELSKLVSHEGPLRMVRYPSQAKPATPKVPVGNLPPMPTPPPGVVYAPHVPMTPGYSDLGLQRMLAGSRRS